MRKLDRNQNLIIIILVIKRLIFLGYSELYGVSKCLDEAKHLLATHPLYDAIGCLSRIELILIDPTFEDTSVLIENQKDICKCTCSLKQLRVIEKVAEDIRIRNRTDVILFHRPQVATAMKLAFMNCPEDGQPPEYLDALAETLFIINDHIGLTPEYKPPEYLLWVRQSQFITSETNLLYYLARWYALTKKVEAKMRQTQLDLENRFISKYGTGLINFVTMGLDFYMQWVVLRPREDIDKGIVTINLTQLKNRSKLGKTEFNRALQEFCQPPSFFQRSIHIGNELLDPFNNVAFLRKPLVRFNNILMCLGKHFLTMKIGTGLYWLLVELYERDKEDTSRRDVMKLYGEAFSEYSMEILRRIFGNRSDSPLIDIDRIITNEHKKRKVDALIDCGDSLIVIEFKSSQFPIELLSSKNVDDFHRWEREHLLQDGAEQIYSFIAQLINGALPEFGFTRRIKKYYPLIITLQQLPTAVPSYLRHFVVEAERIKNRELGNAKINLNDISLEPINLLSISELEQVEPILTNPGCEEKLKDIIDKKNQEDRYSSWLPFLHQFFYKYNFPKNEHLFNLLKEFVSEGLAGIFPPKKRK